MPRSTHPPETFLNPRLAGKPSWSPFELPVEARLQLEHVFINCVGWFCVLGEILTACPRAEGRPSPFELTLPVWELGDLGVEHEEIVYGED